MDAGELRRFDDLAVASFGKATDVGGDTVGEELDVLRQVPDRGLLRLAVPRARPPRSG